MMLGSEAVSLAFTILFAVAALGAALRVVRSARLRPAERAGAGYCVAMCAALIAMAWWAEPAGAVWLQVAAFGGAALWLLLAGGVRAGLHHVLMAAAMTWMLTAVGGTPSLLVLTVSGLVAASCVAASIPWVTADRRIGEAAMSVGMAAMLLVML